MGFHGGNVAELRRDGVQRCLPGNALEFSFAFPARPLHGIQQPLVAVGAVQVARYLGAQRALRGRMIGRALNLYGDTVFHRDQHGTGIGTIVRAGGAHDLVEWDDS